MTDPQIQIFEQTHLEDVQRKLKAALAALDVRVQRYARQIKEQTNYFWENRAELDKMEKVFTRQTAQQFVQSGDVAAAVRDRIEKLIQSPWFGRIDFQKALNEKDAIKVYIGIQHFVDEETRQNLIYDWRAPIATMFYDFEPGPARYISPGGVVEGELTLKRQFRIRRGKMEFVLESGLNIVDDVLQEELSRTSDERMKNIVATIQRDQNAIIRNEDAPVLIIQGVAGSGKTSIALHRIAFLLYRHRDTLSSKDILIISPNKVFGDFISNVLPELGETQIAELGMEQLADELLERQVTFQTFFEQTAALHEKGNDAMAERIRAKSTVDFVKQIDAYVAHVKATRFCATDIQVGRHPVLAWMVEWAFNKRPDLPISQRLKWTAEKVAHEIQVRDRVELSRAELTELRRAINKMYRKATLRTLYKALFAWLERPDLFKTVAGGKLEYADVFPFIYLKMQLEGIATPLRPIKHLLVDEMQDYTPVQYTVLSKLFDCDKTILGDAHQSVNPHSSSRAETISEVFRHSECVYLKKSYRSSWEITRFASAISGISDIDAVHRHGEHPSVHHCKSKQKEVDAIALQLDRFLKGPYRTLAIICKTHKQAEKWHSAISAQYTDAHLLTPGSTTFEEGITVCSVHLSKGLEFDHVIVPDVTEKNYCSDMDGNLLYVACTRAMHLLTLTHVGTPSPFVVLPDIRG